MLFGVTDTTCMTGLFSQMQLLGNALDGAQQVHRVVSQNIANVNTPGYQTRQVDFQKLIQQLELNSEHGAPPDDVVVQKVKGLAERVDGNNVDMEREMGQLKKNALAYQAYSHLMASKLATMRRAISS
jgi:flagellar basal-body rod protein FlgB